MTGDIKRINPIEGVLKTLETVMTGNPRRGTALNYKAESFIVDTCIGFDTDMWETGIKNLNESWIIVEQYENKEYTKKGHNRWIKAMTENPKMKLTDIDLWGLDEFGDEDD